MDYNTLLQELFKAYYDCRKNKRKTINQLQFEIEYESNLIQLADEIYNGNYEVGKSIAFIVDKPVKREIFAGDFRDRVVHHYVINQINHIFENLFIHDSYSCREGKGTLFGIKRIEKFIKSCSKNYTEDCYIMKLDIQGFFMSIDKDILWKKIEKIVETRFIVSNIKKENSKQDTINRVSTENKLILNIIQKIISNDPIKNCIIKGDKTNWKGLPKSKSLFFARKSTGLPIGNLTSQIFANLYLDSFDKFIKHKLKIKYYGRYVDDFILIHADKKYLLYCKNEIEKYLKIEFKLTLHPNKFYLQNYKKGVLFLGAFIKPYTFYSGKRTKGNFYEKIQKLNHEIKLNPGVLNTSWFGNKSLSIINSYLGFLKHYKSYGIRKNYSYKIYMLLFGMSFISVEVIRKWGKREKMIFRK